MTKSLQDLEFEELKKEVLELEKLNKDLEDFRKTTGESFQEYLARELRDKVFGVIG